MRPRLLPLLATAFLTAACGGTEKAASDRAVTTATPDSAHNMAAMGGMGAMAHHDTIADRVVADLDRMAKASTDSAKVFLPAHRAIVTALIADCDKMMRDMKMTPPAKWTAATAAVRADLDRMPGMNAVQINGFIPAHRKRVEAILAMRHDMMPGKM